jgi:hypothetical protein
MNELSLFLSNRGKTWLTLQPRLAAASAQPEMSFAKPMHNIAPSLALLLRLSTALALPRSCPSLPPWTW